MIKKYLPCIVVLLLSTERIFAALDGDDYKQVFQSDKPVISKGSSPDVTVSNDDFKIRVYASGNVDVTMVLQNKSRYAREGIIEFSFFEDVERKTVLPPVQTYCCYVPACDHDKDYALDIYNLKLSMSKAHAAKVKAFSMHIDSQIHFQTSLMRTMTDPANRGKIFLGSAMLLVITGICIRRWYKQDEHKDDQAHQGARKLRT